MNIVLLMHFTFCLIQSRMCFLRTHFQHLIANIKNSMTFVKILGDLFHDAGSISDYLIWMAG